MELTSKNSASGTGWYGISFAVLQTPSVGTAGSHSIHVRPGFCCRGSVTRRSRRHNNKAQIFCAIEKSGKKSDHPSTPKSEVRWSGTGLYFPNMTESDQQYLEDAPTSEEYLRRMGIISQRIQTERLRNQPAISKQSADDYVNSLSDLSKVSSNSARHESVIGDDNNGRNEGENYIMQLAEQSKSKKSVPKLRDPFDFDNDMRGRNAGEEYMAKLAKQSSRKKLEPSSPKMRDPIDVDRETQSRNAGEEYMSQLRNQSVLKKSVPRSGRRELSDDAERRNMSDDNITKLVMKSASTASNLAAKNASREIDAGMGEDDSSTSALDDEIAKLEMELAALENDLDIASEKLENDRPVARASSTRTERIRTQDEVTVENNVEDERATLNSATADELDSYDRMRDMVSQHVSPPSGVASYDFVEASDFGSVSVDNGVDVESLRGESSQGNKALEEGSPSELAMVEIQIEMERYKIAARNLLEKHEQHIQTIIEKYMPGL